MLDTVLKDWPASDRQSVPLSTTGQQEAARAIIQSIFRGCPVTAIIANSDTVTKDILDTALAELAARGTRVICLRKTMVSCLGVASSMDRLKVGEINGRETRQERSRQIEECLQLLDRPVPGETRRVFVLEGAESVDPGLLGSLVRIPPLDHPNLPLQLICVGEASYWDGLSACRQEASGHRIGSPIFLFHAPESRESPRPGRVASRAACPASLPRTMPRRRRVRRALLAGLAPLGCVGLLVAGAINRTALSAFIQAHPLRLQEGSEISPAPAAEVGRIAGVVQVRAGHAVPLEDRASGPTPTTARSRTEPGASTGGLAASTPRSVLPTVLTDSRLLSSQNPEPPPPLGGPTPGNASASRIVSTAIDRGNAMLASHDFSAARLYYELAADAGSADAALALGRTYDPTSLIRSAAVSAQPDKVLAARWYRKAAMLGSEDAARSLRNLKRQQPD